MSLSPLGSSPCAVAVTPADKLLVFSGKNYFRQGLNLTLRGHDATPENLVLVCYRNNDAGEGVLCAVAPADGFPWAGTSSVATVTLVTNTEELELLMDGVSQGAERYLDARLWNQSTMELVARGRLALRGTGYTYDDDTGVTPTPPVSGTTIIWGNLATSGGKTYLKNNEDGLWYPIDLRGSGSAVYFEDHPGEGITLP